MLPCCWNWPSLSCGRSLGFPQMKGGTFESSPSPELLECAVPRHLAGIAFIYIYIYISVCVYLIEQLSISGKQRFIQQCKCFQAFSLSFLPSSPLFLSSPKNNKFLWLGSSVGCWFSNGFHLPCVDDDDDALQAADMWKAENRKPKALQPHSKCEVQLFKEEQTAGNH